MAQDEGKLYVLFCGGVGNGKSSLLKALCNKNLKKLPKSGDNGRGVTKTIGCYQMDINVAGKDSEYGLDTPGPGDHDAPISQVVTSIEEAVKQCGLNAIVICNQIPSGRVDMGCQIAARLISAGVLKNQKNAYQNVIFCGTKGDLVRKKRVEKWKTKVAPEVKSSLGGMPGYIVTTSLGTQEEQLEEDEEDDELKPDDVKELVDALRDIYKNCSTKELSFNAASEDELANMLNQVGGLELEKKQVVELGNKIKKDRKKVTNVMDNFKKRHKVQNKTELVEKVAEAIQSGEIDESSSSWCTIL